MLSPRRARRKIGLSFLLTLPEVSLPKRMSVFEGFNWKGGVIAYEGLDFDPAQPLVEQLGLLKEDLLQVEFGRDLIVDLGWCPSHYALW